MVGLTTLRPFLHLRLRLFCLPFPFYNSYSVMKSMSAALLLFVASALAQSISIAIPAEGATLTAGEPTTVELDFPVSA